DGGDAVAAAPAAAAAAGGGGPPGECLLRFIDGERKGTDLPLRSARTTFGRRPSNTVSFDDASVSGVHCEITREPNGFVLRDLGSTNGTQVDGEPVVETVLRHNARIRIGAQRVLFVDTTVADIESSLAGGDDASEWGLMRGELDVHGGRRRGGAGALLAAAVVLAAAGGGSWFVLQAKGQRVEGVAIKDNRIGDSSFEDGVVRWFSPGDRETAVARIDGSLEKPRAASGVQCLEVVPQGLDEADGPGLVAYRAGSEASADAAVTPDVAYEIGARVGGGTGSVVVQWILSSRPGLVREVSTPPVEGNSSWPETKAVVTAPAGVTGARVLLAAYGGGAAAFDDVFVRRAEGPAAPALASGELKVSIDAAGCLEAVDGSEILLTQGGLAPSCETPPALLLGNSLSGPPLAAGPVLSAKAAVRAGGAFRVEAEAVQGGARLSVHPEGAPGALTFTLPAGLARGAVTLVQEKTAIVLPEEESFKADGVVKIIVGTSEGPKPFLLAAAPGSPGWSFTSRRTPRGLRVQLAPPAAKVEGVDGGSAWLSVDLSREKEAAEALLRGARTLETAGKLGEAVGAFEKVTVEYHYLPEYRSQAEKAGGVLLEKGKARLKAARALAAGAVRFRFASDLEAVEKEAALLSSDYAGHPIGEEALALGKEAAAELLKVREEGVADRIESLYRRASDFRETGQTALAVLFLDEILRIAPPGNEYREDIEKDLPALRQKVKDQQASLFGKRR
ncbi:MAG: FHA domain-containing protein, partial [Planctomycetes bacterium]|nr:FHA domain-containing protein [Planctomycetota bacterium]